MSILEALLDLNKALLEHGYKSDYELCLSEEDFCRFVSSIKYVQNVFFDDPEKKQSFENLLYVQIPGHGSYLYVRRKHGDLSK